MWARALTLLCLVMSVVSLHQVQGAGVQDNTADNGDSQGQQLPVPAKRVRFVGLESSPGKSVEDDTTAHVC